MRGAVAKAEELLTKSDNAFMPQQFNNPANPEIHYKTTAPEIWSDTDGNVDIFVAAVGTGGTLSGCAKFLKEKNPEIQIVAVEPETSAVLSGEGPGKHAIQGIGAGFIPDVLDTAIIDETFKVKDDDALETAKKLAKGEGILCGISSGANVFAAAKIAGRPENKNKTIVTILCDTGERYLTTSLFQN
jgi:cysteine synthase A